MRSDLLGTVINTNEKGTVEVDFQSEAPRFALVDQWSVRIFIAIESEAVIFCHLQAPSRSMMMLYEYEHRSNLGSMELCVL
jgi:hypothetical protein